MTADMIQVISDMTPCAACHGTAHVSVFSGKIVSEVNVVVRTDNQSVPKIHIWLSVTNFWLSWTTGQPLLRTLLCCQAGARTFI